MLGYKHSDITMEERILKVAGLGAFLSSALAAVSVALGEWSGFFTSPLPLGSIAAIACALVVMAALFFRYFEKRYIRNTILIASGSLALFITYKAGVYGLILVTGAAVLSIAAVPNKYRLLTGYSIAALMSVTLLLSEALNPSAESLRVFMTLALIPYPIALLLNTSLPQDAARLKALNFFLILGVITTLLLMAEEGFKANLVVSLVVTAISLSITRTLNRIPPPIGIAFLIIASLVALYNSYSVGTVFAPFLIAYLVVPFLLFGPVLNLSGAFVILIGALIGFSQYPGALDVGLLVRMFFASLILVVCLFYVSLVRSEDEEKAESLADFLKRSRVVTNAVLAITIATTTLLVYLVINSYNVYKVETETNTRLLTQLLTLERLIIDRETGHKGYLLTADEDILNLYTDAEVPLKILLGEITLSSESDFSDRFAVLLESQDAYYQHTFDLLLSGNKAAVINLVASGVGIAYNNSLRGLIEREISIVSFQTSRLKQDLVYTDLTLILAIFLMLFLSIILGRNSSHKYKQLVFEPLERLGYAFAQSRANEPLSVEPYPAAATEVDYVVRSAKEMAQRNSENANALDLQQRILAFASESAGLYSRVVNIQTLESELSSGILALVEYDDPDEAEQAITSAEIFHPDDRQTVIDYRLKCEAQSVEHEDTDTGIIVRVVSKSGKVIWIRHKARFMQIADQTYRVGTWQDISSLIETQQALTLSEQRVLKALETAEIGLWSWELKSNKLILDVRTSQIYGLNREADGQLSYPVWRDSIHPEDIEETEHRLERTLNQGENYFATYRIITPTGEIRYSESSGYPEYSDDGSLVRIVGFSKDITEQKGAEKTLRLERARFRDILEGTNAATWEWNVQTGVTVFNERWAQIIGYTLEELAPVSIDTWIKFVHPDDAMQSAKLLEAHFNGESDYYELEARMLHKDGHWVWVMDRGRVHSWTEEGEPEWMSGTHIEITELKRAQQAADQANSAKSQFLANMSHEIRTPMNSVLGIAQLLARRDRYPKDVVIQADKIVRAGQSLQQILNDILDMSKIESGKLELSPVTFSLSEMLENVAVLMGSAASEKQIELVISCNEPVDNLYVADQQRLEQVLVNLLSNAIKFTEHGSVTLEVKRVSGSGPETLMSFKVIDTGIGISEERINKICQPFSQADETISRRFGGTGLGLAISSELLHLMGSDLNIDSTLGQGSSFGFEVSMPDSSVDYPVQHEANQLCVLIAEDDPATRDAVESAVSSLGWRATVAKQGEEAIQLYSDSLRAGVVIDLLILDWQMPGKDGLSVASEIKQISQQAQLEHPPAVIMVTGFSREDVLRSPQSQCADFVINKPVTSAGLRNAFLTISRPQDDNTEAYIDAKNEAGPLNGIRILAVDDNLYNRDVAKLVFEAEGAVVSLAEDGEDALHWLSHNLGKVDAVLMDVQMPNMDGLEATRMIRKNPLMNTLPIIGMSGGGYESDYKSALDAGMDAYLTKPIDVRLALETMRQQLSIQTPVDTRTPSLHESMAPDTLFDRRAAIEFWKDPAKVAHYLGKFRADFGEVLLQTAGDGYHPDPAELHKIKGAASTLYLYGIYSVLQNLETELTLGVPEGGLFDKLNETWRMTCAEIDKFIAEHSPNVKVDPHPPKQIQTLPIAALEHLLAAVEQYDPDEVSRVLSPLLATYDAALLREVEQAVDSFDFTEAASILNTELTVRGVAE